MAHRVEWTPPAQRDLSRLPIRVVIAVLAYTARLARPAPANDYRVLFEIDDDPPVLRIVRVDHRAHAYRGR